MAAWQSLVERFCGCQRRCNNAAAALRLHMPRPGAWVACGSLRPWHSSKGRVADVFCSLANDRQQRQGSQDQRRCTSLIQQVPYSILVSSSPATLHPHLPRMLHRTPKLHLNFPTANPIQIQPDPLSTTNAFDPGDGLHNLPPGRGNIQQSRYGLLLRLRGVLVSARCSSARVQQYSTLETHHTIHSSPSLPWDDWRNSRRGEIFASTCLTNAGAGRGHGCRPLTRTGFRDL